LSRRKQHIGCPGSAIDRATGRKSDYPGVFAQYSISHYFYQWQIPGAQAFAVNNPDAAHLAVR